MAELILSAFAVYSITTILTETDGPMGLIYKLRELKWLTALRCFMCASVYVSAVTSLLVSGSLKEWAIYTFGFSGVSILAHKLAGEY